MYDIYNGFHPDRRIVPSFVFTLEHSNNDYAYQITHTSIVARSEAYAGDTHLLFLEDKEE